MPGCTLVISVAVSTSPEFALTVFGVSRGCGLNAHRTRLLIAVFPFSSLIAQLLRHSSLRHPS
jgi:hypothetical protein